MLSLSACSFPGMFFGPERLGRGVVVMPDQPLPPSWADRPRLVVDESILADADRAAATAGELRAAWMSRTPTVVVLGVDPERLKTPEVERRPPYQLDAGFTFVPDQLRFLVWANNYDLRSGTPVWWHGVLARRLGASPSRSADATVEGVGEVWVDGGPRTPLEGLRVVHRESVEARRLTLARHSSPAEDLAPDQLAAVATPMSMARVIAPAGSGKTRVLTARLRHLLVDRGYEPELVTAVAYNNRAAAEMRHRIADLPEAQVRTIHALGFEIVRAARPGVGLIGEREARDVIARLAAVRPQPNTDVYAPYLEALAQVRLGLRDPAEVERTRGDVAGFAQLFDRYRQALADRNAIDFDEQIYAAVEVLLGRPELRERFQRRCRHLLVDEFQDLTPTFVLLLRLLAAPAWQVWGVGDDDQTIYGYLGAQPGFLVDYTKLFPGAISHNLEVNYRCPLAVVTATCHLLARNHHRLVKQIRPSPTRSDQADSLRVIRVAEDELATAVVERVALWAAGMPARTAMGAEVLSRTGMAMALTWLRLAADPRRMAGVDVAEALRRSPRKIRRETLERLAASATWDRQSLVRLAFDELQVWEGRELRGWVDDLHQVAAAGRVSVTAALEVVRRAGLDEMVGQLDRSGHDAKRSTSHRDDLDALAQVAALHPRLEGFEAWLGQMLADPGQDGGVTLASVHATKGNEFDHVIIYAANRGLMPHRLAAPNPRDQEEERRVFHVALTRGRRTLEVLADRNAPSPYLDELTHPPPPQPAGRRTGGSRRLKATPGHDPSVQTVTVAVGEQLTAPGGLRGEVVAVTDEGAQVRLSSGATTTVRWGSRVQTRNRTGTLTK